MRLRLVRLAAPALAHRVLLNTQAQLAGRSVTDLLAAAVREVPVPTGRR